MQLQFNAANLHILLMRAANDGNIRDEIFWKLVSRNPEMLMNLANGEITPEVLECTPDNLRSSRLPRIGASHTYHRDWITLREHERIQLHMKAGRKVDAIKELRAITGAGLKDAKDCVESGAFDSRQTILTFSLNR